MPEASVPPRSCGRDASRAGRSICAPSWVALLAILMIAAAGSAAAQEPITIPRIQEAVELDGRLDEPVWAALDPLPMTMMMPTFEGSPSVTSEVYLGYDDDFLYLAGRLFDHPDSIQAVSYKRDLLQPNSDWFGILIDSFNDNENGFGFYTAPTGLRLDFSIANDAQTGPRNDPPMSESWDTFWDVAVTQDDEGWYAEMRIPFSSLRFESSDGIADMGIIVMRGSGKRSETYTYPSINPVYGQWSWVKPSIAQTARFEGIDSSRPVYVTPYVLGGVEQSFELNGDGTAYDRNDEPRREIGLDLKYGLTDNLALDVTVNTDFAQVEADEEQVNLSRRALFFPEKRRFFLERASMFEFNLGGQSRLFYSRRIGLHEGRIVPIIGGAKIAGRIRGWDVGILNMQTAEAAGLPSENHGAYRLRTQTFNPFSYSGGILTTRLGVDGTYNFAFGTDHTVRVFGDDYAELVLAQTFDDQFGTQPLDLSTLRLVVGWERRTFAGLNYWARYSRAGPDYRPDLGFESREDFQFGGSRVGWGWLLGEGSALQSHRVQMRTFSFWRTSDNSLESLTIGPEWEGTWKNGWALRAQLEANYEDLREPLSLPGVEVPPGSYRFYGVQATLQAPGTRDLWGDAMVNAGSFYGGTRISVSVNPIWTLSRFLELQPYYEFNRVELGDGLDGLTAHITRIRAQATFNTEWALGAFVQYNSAVDAVLTNIRLRYNPREGNDLYLVYNEGLNTNRSAFDPMLPLTSARTILVKYTYTFRW